MQRYIILIKKAVLLSTKSNNNSQNNKKRGVNAMFIPLFDNVLRYPISICLSTFSAAGSVFGNSM